MRFLEHIISEKGIIVDPKKVTAVEEWVQLTNRTKVRSFLGLVRYYRRFVEKFSIIVALLTKLTHKNVKFLWTEEFEKVFKELK